jgi:hypothetical protein
MSEQGSNSENLPGTDCAVGYCRPPTHSRFRPGQSGNPKGRRKGSRGLSSLRKELYLSLVPMREGNQIKKIPRVLAIDIAVLNRALRGDPKAAQLASKTASELGVYEETFPNESKYPVDLTVEQFAKLSSEDRKTMIRILKKAYGIPNLSVPNT